MRFQSDHRSYGAQIFLTGAKNQYLVVIDYFPKLPEFLMGRKLCSAGGMVKPCSRHLLAHLQAISRLSKV